MLVRHAKSYCVKFGYLQRYSMNFTQSVWVPIYKLVAQDKEEIVPPTSNESQKLFCTEHRPFRLELNLGGGRPFKTFYGKN